ncbi:nardilysin-like [Eucyclogobius newberryi]|uniref:nardilysin-like n=1 Tax=Eucyclogobius newberryi TaxID=166745 RepID=UPI003B59298C
MSDPSRPDRSPDPVLDQDQGDPDILKSPNDPKKYRYLELSNGLRVLLISDLSLSSKSCSSQLQDSPEEASGEGEASGKGEGVQPQNTSEKQAAAALCVAVGSFSDPDDLPGLAHFLEHMVFMGSEKFPEENDFDAFLKKHAGSDNAFTDSERTVFYFHIEERHFRSALDRWSQFFVCPLMVEDAVDRELEVVDSEFQLARSSDSQRKEMLFGSLSKPGHPMGKFSWGNTQTLKLEPRERGINTYERLRQFWRRYYTAQYMTLTVQSRESLDTLESWVREIFIHIPNNGEAAVDFSHLQAPFDTPHFNKLYRVVPVKKVNALTISWALPPQAQHYRVKPLHYVSWLIEHEGTGSVLSLLRKKSWALALFGGNHETGFVQNSTYSIFSVTITLTEQGYANVYEVAHVLFQYLKLLQTRGPQQRIYEEIQKIQDNEFLYQEQMDPVDCVSRFCENMQLFPKEHFLTGDDLLLQFNPEVISAALSPLVPLRANFMLLSPWHQGQCEVTEKWFGSSYSVQDLPEVWSKLWTSDFELNLDLYLPEPNHFISSDFSLRTADTHNSHFPERVQSSQRGALWYKRDDTFRIPKAHLRFHLISPVVQRSPENLVLFDLLVLAHNLAEPAYAARVALLDYKLVAAEHGMMIQMQGFNHKLSLLVKMVVSHLSDFRTDSSVFEVFSEQLKKVYYNQLITPERLGKDVRLRILEPSRWSVVHKHQVLVQGLNLDHFQDFVSEFKQQLFVEGLVQGNVSCQESKEFLQCFLDALQFPPLPAEAPVQFRVVELPQKHLLCKVKCVNDDAHSEVTVYYQSGLKNLKQHVLMELLVSHMEEPCFDFLRTKETLGYQVFPSYRNTSGVLGMSITVQTHATKFSSDWVECKMEAFLQAFGGRLSFLSADAFQTQVEALVKQKQNQDSHLGQEVERNWSEVVTQQYVFDRALREVDALLSFSQDDLEFCFSQLRQETRKLSVHVVGFGSEEGDSSRLSAADGAVSSSYSEVIKLHFLSSSLPWLQEATPIYDITTFTAELPLHPYHKVLQ